MINSPSPVFVVGFPRSGTTYLQSLLAKNKNLLCLPETQFFVEIYGYKNLQGHKAGPRRILKNAVNKRLNEYLGVSYDQWKKRYKKLEKNRSFRCSNDSVTSLFIKKRVEAFDELLRCECRSIGAKAYAEKSPAHIFYINEIQEHLADAKFIHIIREPASTAASVADAMLNNSSWKNRYSSTDSILRHWDRAFKISMNYRFHKNHHIITHEELKTNTDQCLESIFSFLDIPIEYWDENSYKEEQKSLIYPDEIWKSEVKLGSSFIEKDKFKIIESEVDHTLLKNLSDNYHKETALSKLIK